MQTRILLACLLSMSLGGCLTGNDDFSNYAARKDTITLAAGDAQKVNEVTHVIDPWPPYVGNRQIEGSGARAVKAMECYHQRAAISGGPVNSGGGTQINIGGGGGSGGSGGSAAASIGVSRDNDLPKPMRC